MKMWVNKLLTLSKNVCSNTTLVTATIQRFDCYHELRLFIQFLVMTINHIFEVDCISSVF